MKAGGLGEVMFALPRALTKLGYDARLFIPRYAGIDLEKFKLHLELEGLMVPTGANGDKPTEPSHLTCNIRKYIPDPHGGNGDLPVYTYFLENAEYYEKRSNVYGYNDDAIRWALLSRGALEFLRVKRTWTPDVIVANDWQTGFLINYLRTEYKNDPSLSSVATVFMIHNLYYQGMFDHRYVSEMDFDDGRSPLPGFFDPRLLKMNGMRRGILSADIINTVSPTYSREIMTKEYGEMLDELLRERRAHIHGILNGIDYTDFDPENDKYIEENYDVNGLENRIKNKLELRARLGLPKDKDAAVISIVSRLTDQKGFDLMFSITEPLLKELNIQMIVVGSGDAKYMGFFKDLADRHPQKIAAHLTFDATLPRLVYGGADMILLPSRFEPCGLSQMEAMRYGVIPIVRKTGGLADSVKDYDPKTGKGNGFTFKEFDGLSFALAITRAYENYRNPETWHHIQKQAMMRDFSWYKSAEEYARLFETAIDFRTRTLEG